MDKKQLPLHFENRYLTIYGSLMERIGASMLDGLFMIPLSIGMLYFNHQDLYNFYSTFVVIQLGVMAYTIYLPVRYGATPGKRVLGLTILKEDGAPITYRESFLKYLPSLLLALFGFCVQAAGISQADPATYETLSWMEQSQYLQSVNAVPMWLQIGPIWIYLLSNLIVVGQSPRSRSIGDLLAGTVVVKTACLARIAAYREEGTAEPLD